MGKVVGLVGAASGKIGNFVYAVTNGIQTARVYQPNVSNPKSALQNQQRAKGNLAGRISSFVPRTAIMGLGSNARVRRGEFLRNILNRASVNLVNNVYTAKIDDNDIVFSKGSVPISVSNASYGSVTANSFSVQLTGVATAAMPADVYATMQTRIVVMVYDYTTNDLVECVTKIVNKPAQGATAETYININYSAGYYAQTYLIPMSTGVNTAVTINTDLAMRSDSDIIASLSVNSNNVVFSYGNSVDGGHTTFNPGA